MSFLNRIFKGKDTPRPKPEEAPPVKRNIPKNENGDCRCMNCHTDFWYDDFLGLCTSKKCFETDTYQMVIDSTDFDLTVGPRQILLRPETRDNHTETINEDYPIDDILKTKNHICPTCKQRFYFYACPHCRFPIPRLTKEDLKNTIAPAGIVSSGKSIYMTVLIQHLLNNSIIKKDFKLISNFSQTEDFDNYMEKYKTLFQENMVLPATAPGETPLPYLLRTTTREKKDFKKSFTLWYDYSGESFEVESDKQAVIQYFREVGGILLFLDPTNSKPVVDALDISPNDLVKAESIRDQRVLQQIRSLINPDDEFAEGFGKKYIAVIVNKVDLFRGNDIGFFGEDSLIWQPSPHYAAGEFCLDDFYQINREVKDYVEHYHAPVYNQIWDLANSDNSNIGFFAVSSLGSPPNDQYIEKSINPLRVEDPFYWMLWKMGHMRGLDRGDIHFDDPIDSPPNDTPSSEEDEDFTKTDLF